MKKALQQVAWYGFASLCALTADAALLWLLVQFFSVNYVIAATISFSCGAAVAYVLSVRFAFDQHRLRSRRAEFLSFVAIGIPGLAINAAIITVAVEYLGMHYLVAKFAAASTTFVCNFLARRQILFQHRRSVT